MQPPANVLQYGKYELLTQLGQGGMAEVLLARQVSAGRFERIVVIKRILPELAKDELFVEMFLEEARIAALLDHPNVVPIYDLGNIEGSYFIAMPYVSGITLQAMMKEADRRQERIPVPVTCEVVQQALAGLAYAHNRVGLDGKPLSLVHRDITPSNLMVNDEGRVVVLDFGVAVIHDSPNQRSMRGKLAYMSPEQVRREGLDRRSDLFSLGIVMHEMLVGRRLFRRHSKGRVLSAITEEPIPSPRQLRPDLPPQLAAVVQRALQRDRKTRYTNAAQMRTELQAAVKACALELEPDGLRQYLAFRFGVLLERQQLMVRHARSGLLTKEQVFKPEAKSLGYTVYRRRRRYTALLAAVVLAGLAAGGWLWWHNRRPGGAPVRFGVTPYLSARVLRHDFAPLQRFLERRIARRVELVVTDSYEQMADAVLAGRVHLADLPAYPFLLARARDPALRPLVMATSPSAYYHAYITVRAGEAQRLGELRGKRICYVDPTSTSGYLMPRAMLRKAGFEPDRFFSSVQFSGDHQRALRDLLAGRCDAAAVYSDAYHAEPKSRTAKTRIVAISPALPPGVICASPRVAPALARQLRDALLAFDTKRLLGRETLSKVLPITGYAPADVRAFAALAREIPAARLPRAPRKD